MRKLFTIDSFYINSHFCQRKNINCHNIESMNFWEKVDLELTFLGKSRKELATAVGFDATSIRRGSVPAADTALKTARFLGVSLDYLLEMNEEAESDCQKNTISEIDNCLRRFSQSDLEVILAVVNAIGEKY